WSLFWSTSMDHKARNIMYQTFHQNLPTSSVFYKFKLPFVSSPTCRLCNTTTENNTHFIFSCPLKQQVWRLVWNHFSSRDPRPSAFIHFIHTGDPPFSIFTHKQLFCIFSCTILSIWRSHWNFIFNDTPFIPS
ncbi:hypothetical protein BDC45DRAFT_419664, partial [Circinella umbellata]